MPEGKESKEEADKVGRDSEAWMRWLGVAMAGVGVFYWAVNKWAG